MTSLKTYLRSHGQIASKDFNFILRARMDHVDEDVKQRPTEKSPGQWAFHLGTCASVLNIFAYRMETGGEENVAAYAQFVGFTPERLVKTMKLLTEKIEESVKGYHDRQIDSQVSVTVKPFYDRTAKAVLRWKAAKTPAASGPQRPDSSVAGAGQNSPAAAPDSLAL